MADATTVKEEKDGRKWSDEEVELLIEKFEAQPCLWDISLKEYHLRDGKNRAYSQISMELDIPVVDIKAKWCSLRAQLLRERTKQEKSKSGMACGELYRSNWRFYDRMKFVTKVKKTAKSSSTIDLDVDDDVDDENENDVEESYSIMDSSTETPSTSRGKTDEKKTNKRRKTELMESVAAKKNVLLSTCIDALKTPDEKIHPFALYISKQLGELDEEGQILAEKRINDVFFELRYRKFTRNNAHNNIPGVHRPIPTYNMPLSLPQPIDPSNSICGMMSTPFNPSFPTKTHSGHTDELMYHVNTIMNSLEDKTD